MSRLDELPPDQRAALSLLLRQRKTYAEVAAMLAIPEQAVHDRAHAALAVLVPRLARELPPERRLEIGDYMLGQQTIADRLRTRTYLGSSEPARSWAQALSAELAPLADGALAEIPVAEASGAPQAGAAVTGASGELGPVSDYVGSPAPSPSSRQSSRLGGALLLALIVAAIVVAIVLLSGGGSSHKPPAPTAKATSTGPTLDARILMRSPSRNSRSVGLVEILSEGSRRAFFVAAEQLPATSGFFYALWLSNSPSSHEPLGKAPPVGASHRLEGGGALPANAGEFREILLTRETSIHATHPGRVVLRGRFSLGS